MGRKDERVYKSGRRLTRQQRITAEEQNESLLLIHTFSAGGHYCGCGRHYRLLFSARKSDLHGASADVLGGEDWEGAPPLDVQLLTVTESWALKTRIPLRR